MGLPGRRAAVVALLGVAESSEFRERADAGRALASFAELPAAQEGLLELVLDTADTFVTRETAEALLRRRDGAGLAIVAKALATADFQHMSRIHAAVLAVFGVFATDRDDAVRMCKSLILDDDEQVRGGAGELLDMLTEITPVLYPQQDG
ncbi:hypothetical protein [Micromonospora zhanjiangensis]|uniref:HEAT repeat-containing protein n=1 Tax=Micromonospora zhanjiangensis TaxID=1522057 RepID=A0ABV8KMI4_9ACTN